MGICVKMWTSCGFQHRESVLTIISESVLLRHEKAHPQSAPISASFTRIFIFVHVFGQIVAQ